MRASINRFTACLAFTAIFELPLFTQTFPTLNPPQVTAAIVPPQANRPHCAFDEWNDWNSANDPRFRKELQEHRKKAVPHLSQKLEKNVLEPLLSVPVVVHIIHSGEPPGQGQNLSDEQVRAQIDVLNEDYASLNPQYFQTPGLWMPFAAVPNIQFCLANKDPNGNASTGITRHQIQVTGSSWNNNNVNSTIKPQTNWDPGRYMNVYVLPIPGTTAAGGVVGYSNYPLPNLIGTPTDGIVIDYRWFGAPGFAASGYRPLTHESGHYLGLPHTFDGNSCNEDDGINDTPDIEKATSQYMTLDCENGYPVGPNTCNNLHMYVNYMDYVDENCYTSFTQGQVNVMRAVLNGTSQGYGYGSRNNLLVQAPQLCALAANDAGITRILAPAPTTCTSGQLIPSVTLRNFGVSPMVSVKVVQRVFTANGLWGAPDTLDWQGTMFPGENQTVTLPGFTPPNGNYTLEIYTISPNNVNDQRKVNDTTTVSRLTYVTTAPPIVEDFENETVFPSADGYQSVNITGDAFTWGISTSASGSGQGAKSARFDNFAGSTNSNPGGTFDALVTRHFDFSELESPLLKFDVAYAPFNTVRTDTLYVMITTNCSQVFNTNLYKKGGSHLATAPATTQPFVPNSTQWRTETIDLSAYEGFEDITLAFLNYSGWGNRVYLDNIRVGRGCAGISAGLTTAASGCATCSGQAEVSISEGNGGYTFQWATPQNFGTLAGNGAYSLCPGAVSVTVTDALGCTATASTVIEELAAIQATLNVVNETLNDGNNGSAAVNLQGGIPPYTYIWSNGATSSSVANLSPGQYFVIVSDAQQCDTMIQFTVLPYVCPNMAVTVSPTNVSCNGASDGLAAAIPVGGGAPFTFQWNTSGTAQVLTGLSPGAYAVTITDSHLCTATGSATITQPAAIFLSVSATPETSLDANDGTASASVSGGIPGYQYLWSNGATSPSVSNLSPGSYTVTVTDASGCTKSQTVFVQAITCDDFQSVITWTNATCNGAANGTATVEVSGSTPPVAFLWSNGATSQSVNNLPEGPISVSVSDAEGCGAILGTTITQPPAIQPNVTVTHETAPGANDGTALSMPTGGTPLYQFLWTNGSGMPMITNLSPGNYSVTVTDGNNCTAEQTVLINPFNCFITLQTNVTPAACPTTANGSATAVTTNGNGNVTYLWSTGDTSAQIANLLPGSYVVTATDALGCSQMATAVVTGADNVAPMIVLQQVTLQLDANGTATLDPQAVAGGTTDNCSMVNLQVSPNTFDCSNAGSNAVVVTATDASGNTATAAALVTVVETVPPVITCPADLTFQSCTGVVYDAPVAADNCGTATTTLLQGMESGELFPVGQTEVVWQASDPAGNTSICSFMVTVEYDLSLSYTAFPPSCYGSADGYVDLMVNGGVPPFNIVWSHGGGPLNLPGGVYTVTVGDVNGCTASETIEVEEPDSIFIDFLSVIPAANGLSNGVIAFSIVGGTPAYELVWLENGVAIPGFDPQQAAPGTYQLQVTDENGCIALSEPVTVENSTAAEEAAWVQVLHLFPNPTTGAVTLEIPNSSGQPFTLTIGDAMGRKLWNMEIRSSAIGLDFAGFPTGVYLLLISGNDGQAVRRVVRL
jgi:hypothetical protein